MAIAPEPQTQNLGQVDIFKKAKVPENEVETVLAQASKHPNAALNDDQLEAITGTRSMSAGFQLIQAPAGTGKTTTISLLANAYVKLGFAVLLCAPTSTVGENGRSCRHPDTDGQGTGYGQLVQETQDCLAGRLPTYAGQSSFGVCRLDRSRSADWLPPGSLSVTRLMNGP